MYKIVPNFFFCRTWVICIFFLFFYLHEEKKRVVSDVLKFLGFWQFIITRGPCRLAA